MIMFFRNTLFAFAAIGATAAISDDPAPRHSTPIVKTIGKVQPAVAAVYVRKNGGQGAGSGSVIDPRGYVLTAKHVVGDAHVVLLAGRPPLQAQLIGTMPEFDLALLKLGRKAFDRPASPTYPLAGTPPAFIPLGRADEIMLGESILNIGSPGGRGIVVTRGIISSLGISGGNALSLATQSSNGFNQFLQFDAANNPGNSGGALVNEIGQQIGLVTSSIRGEEGVHFAVPPDTIRQSISEMLNSELRHRYVSGITVDPQLGLVTVTRVDAESPADKAGIKSGDVIVSINGRPLRDPIDWEFTRFELSPEQKIELGLKRGAGEHSATLTLAKREPQPGVTVEDAAPGLLSRASEYDPRMADPLSDDVRPAGPPSVVAEVTATPPNLPRDEHYEVLMEGYLKIDEPGLYRLALKSDDGSRLFVHDRLTLDNGGNHAAQLRTGWADLAAGLHPIRIEYYEDQGHEVLELLMAKGDEDLRPVTSEELLHAKLSE